MAFHIRDRQTDEVVRRLAKRKGVSLTTAVREAAQNELQREEGKLSLWERTADIRARLNSYPATGLEADKAFYDSLYEDD